MKSIITILAIASVFLSCSLLQSCNKDSNNGEIKSTKIIVICDLTDSFLLHPDPDPILALFDFEKNKNQEAALDIALITDRQLNPVLSLHLTDGATTEKDNIRDDIHNRNNCIKEFYASARKKFGEASGRFQTNQPISHSEIFCSIISQLRKLAASNYKQKKLIVFSDLQENNRLFNAYSPEDRSSLQQDPEAVGKLLSSQCDIPKRLDGITIFFVYQARSREEDTRFMDMASVYQLMLERRGARIIFQADNNNFKQHEQQ